MPPKWSLGYHQCRYSYDSSEKVLQVFSSHWMFTDSIVIYAPEHQPAEWCHCVSMNLSTVDTLYFYVLRHI